MQSKQVDSERLRARLHTKLPQTNQRHTQTTRIA